jgi:hypothetical protein
MCSQEKQTDKPTTENVLRWIEGAWVPARTNEEWSRQKAEALRRVREWEDLESRNVALEEENAKLIEEVERLKRRLCMEDPVLRRDIGMDEKDGP